jgi:hypothetical protein
MNFIEAIRCAVGFIIGYFLGAILAYVLVFGTVAYVIVHIVREEIAHPHHYNNNPMSSFYPHSSNNSNH